MVDTTYQPKVYRKDGGDTQVVASGGKISVETGGDIEVNGVSLIDEVAALSGLDSGELGVLEGATAGSVVNSKAAVYSAAGGLARSSATVTALSSDQAGAAAPTPEFKAICAAGGTKREKVATG